MRRSGSGLRVLALCGMLLSGVAVGAAHAQDAGPDPEQAAKRQRNGAGLRGGVWNAEFMERSGVEQTQSPLFEGYFQKGLDLHLAIENTAAFWRYTQTTESSGTFGSTEEEVTSYLIPLFTALKLYPFTLPEQPFEPYVTAGVGLTLGVEDRNTVSGGILGAAGDGMRFAQGIGLKGGAGFEWRFGAAFGLNAGVRYQWIRFFEDFGLQDTYEGIGFDGGLTYRFQYE